jgi:hypothetical protein
MLGFVGFRSARGVGSVQRRLLLCLVNLQLLARFDCLGPYQVFRQHVEHFVRIAGDYFVAVDVTASAKNLEGAAVTVLRR